MTVAAEQIADLAVRAAEDGRMSRGRTLFRKGAVSDLTVTAGTIVASVRGSGGDRYETTIATTLAPAHVVAEINRSHEPGDRWSIDDLVADGVELCPGEIDLAFTCDCADWEEPCKHVLATFLDEATKFEEPYDKIVPAIRSGAARVEVQLVRGILSDGTNVAATPDPQKDTGIIHDFR